MTKDEELKVIKAAALVVLKNTRKSILQQHVDQDNVKTTAEFISVDVAMDRLSKHDGEIIMDDSSFLALKMKLSNRLRVHHTITYQKEAARI